MTTPITSLVHRLQLEQGYALLADVDEDRMAVPIPESWEKTLQEPGSLDDDAKVDELFEALLQETERHQRTWQPVGGPFPCPFGAGDISGTILYAAPALLALKPFFSRILIKPSPLAIKVMLIAEHQLADAVSRELLLEVGKRLQAEFAGSGEEAPARRFPFSRERRNPRVQILFDVAVLGDRIIRPPLCERLRRLKIGFGPRTRIRVRCHALDTGGKRAWSTMSRLLWGQRRDLAYAIAHCHQSAADIRRQIEAAGVHPGLVAFTVALGLALLVGGCVALLRLLDGELLGVWVILAPVLAVATGVSLPRLKHHVERQVNYFLAIYLTVVIGAWLLTRWPPGPQEALTVLLTNAMSYVFCKSVGTMVRLA